MAAAPGEIPKVASESVLVNSSTDLSSSHQIVKGHDFNTNPTLDFQSLLSTGYQATNLGLAVNQINDMLKLRNLPSNYDTPTKTPDDQQQSNYPDTEKNKGCKIFLGYTSNLISSGLREMFSYIAQHNLVDCIVTTAGGIEEDLIKCLAPTYVGDFSLDGSKLRAQGLNRIGNLLVPNDNYCKFENWIYPILDEMLKEQNENGKRWTPSSMIQLLGERIDDPSSVYYWTSKHHIPVYCPAITDGSLGDMIYFHSFKNPGLVIDVVGDIRRINNQAVFAEKTGAIILGGGVVKHHINNANLMRNGSDYTVFVNTGQEFDGSDSGARPDEAVSWGKIRADAKPVKVYAEATLVFPLIVAETFVKFVENKKHREYKTAEKDFIGKEE